MGKEWTTNNRSSMSSKNTKLQRSICYAFQIKDAKINQDPNVEEFGLKVSDEFQKVTARVLDPPTLEYGNRQVIVPTAFNFIYLYR